MNKWIPPTLLFAILLIVGCGALLGETANESAKEEIPATGGMAVSESYLLRRADIGNSFESTASFAQTYRVDATLGHHLSEGGALSKRFHYETFQPISRDMLITTIDTGSGEEEEEEETTE